VGPGPWELLKPPYVSGYEITADNDPRHLYQSVLVALDASRGLNNGEPAALARWLDCLGLAPEDRVLHIGCGVGYYTAVVAEALSPGGRVVGVEVDRELAERAQRNLRPWPNATVVCADGCDFEAEPFDVIFVNAGATEVLPNWLNSLRSEGRLLVPIAGGLTPPEEQSPD
jgi:protein-L-isoaspartate(D-aspartate) O-methyltransferase